MLRAGNTVSLEQHDLRHTCWEVSAHNRDAGRLGHHNTPQKSAFDHTVEPAMPAVLANHEPCLAVSQPCRWKIRKIIDVHEAYFTKSLRRLLRRELTIVDTTVKDH